MHIDEEGNAPYCADTIFDDVQPALLLFDLYRETGDERYKIVMDRSFRNVEMWPTNAKGGVWHMKFRDNQMWLDTMYMMGVFSARYAKEFDNPYMFEKIHKQMKLMRTYMTDPESGLLYHMWDDSKVEYLNRGTVAIKVDNGVFLSWRLLGTEPTDTTFDIYKNGELLLSNHTNTNYTDADGSENDVYQVVVSSKSIENEKKTTVMSKDYMDIPISKPIPDVAGNVLAGSDYTYSANDATVADLDGDGEYEYILKWDPSNSQDNYYSGYTGNVYIDAYETDGTLMWRIDLGVNIRAGAHYTQFIAYDFDSDGKAEVAMRTAPGSKDAAGTYVTEVGVNLTEGDNTKDYRNTDGRITTAPDYLTMFNGETGAAMQTVDYYVQRGDLGASSGWGGGAADNGSYSERYLAGVAYLDGINPSLIMCRGYYYRATVGAYNWDGENFELIWMIDDKEKGSDSLYGKGAHSLSVSDVDSDGRDEIVYGAAVINDNGTMLYETDLQHGDALHVSDFDNDGDQEVFMVHEHGYTTYGAELHDAKTGEVFVKMGASEDVGRGVMGNIIASNSGSEFWSNANGNLYSHTGKVLSSTKPEETNFLIWWDGDLEREILDVTRIVKYTLDGSTLKSERIKELYGTHSNNGTKQNPSLSADIWGDWREEAVYPTNDNNFLRIYTSTIPTEYKITTLMHDTQYRTAVAWQNVGYNQPPHPSFYVGSEKTEYASPKVETVLSQVDYTEPEVTPTPESVSVVIDNSDFETGDSDITVRIGVVVDVNDVSQEESADAYMALYKADKLVSVSGKKSELVTGANVIDFEDIVIEGTDADDLAAKVFIWKSGTQQPITDALAMDIVPRAKGVLYHNDFEGATESIFTSNNTSRYTVAPATEGENTFERVDVVGNGGNGAYITTEDFAVDAGVNYSISFDMALTPTGEEYVQASYFILRSAADDMSAGLSDTSDYILNLTQATTSTVAEENTTWYINGDEADVVTLTPGAWYSYVVDVVDTVPYLTITDAQGTVVLERKEIADKSAEGGLNGIYYATRRYSAGMAIDNILVKEYE